MSKSRGGFRAALWIGWMVLGAAGLVYARVKGIPNWAALPVLAAFLVEYPFYLATGFPEVRERFAGRRLPLFLVAGIVLPYLACCCGVLQFQWISLVRLAALALALGLWYEVLPAAPWADAGFLALFPWVLLGRYFEGIYKFPVRDVKDAAILGHLALIQIAVMVLLVQRRVPGTGYGFLPDRNEWRIGAIHYLGFLPIAVPLALSLKLIHPVPMAPVWRIAADLLGWLWVVALSEEFLVRGVLQQWMEDWTRSRTGALIAASIFFGLMHLWRGHFPNWRMALIAAVLGWFCGHARNQAGSIRAGMVTHALVVTTWRAFFV